MVRKDDLPLDRELRDHGVWGVEVQVYRELNFCTAAAGRLVPWRSRKPTSRRRGISERAASSSRKCVQHGGDLMNAIHARFRHKRC
jgi:hypothetical protein